MGVSLALAIVSVVLMGCGERPYFDLSYLSGFTSLLPPDELSCGPGLVLTLSLRLCVVC